MRAPGTVVHQCVVQQYSCRTCMVSKAAECASTSSHAPARCSTAMLPGVTVLTRASGTGAGRKRVGWGCGLGGSGRAGRCRLEWWGGAGVEATAGHRGAHVLWSVRASARLTARQAPGRRSLAGTVASTRQSQYRDLFRCIRTATRGKIEQRFLLTRTSRTATRRCDVKRSAAARDEGGGEE